jgi:DNA ligase (NAD+)
MTDKPLLHYSFCLTGKLSTSRTEATAAIERLGGFVQSSITYDTNYLVCGEKVGQTKLNAAYERGVAVISEKELLEMIGT